MQKEKRNIHCSTLSNYNVADFRCSALLGVGLRTLAGSVCVFETHQAQGCLSFLSIVCCPVGVSAAS
jgi:hypothetical protein